MSHITPSTVSLHELMPRRTAQLDDRPWDPGRSAFCAAVAHTRTHTWPHRDRNHVRNHVFRAYLCSLLTCAACTVVPSRIINQILPCPVLSYATLCPSSSSSDLKIDDLKSTTVPPTQPPVISIARHCYSPQISSLHIESS